MVKDAGELHMVTSATEASEFAHRAALKAIHPGVTEREISALMQYELASAAVIAPLMRPLSARDSTQPCCTTLLIPDDAGW